MIIKIASPLCAGLLSGLVLLSALHLVAGSEDSFSFRPEEEGRREIWISNAAQEILWRLRMPERMFCDEAMLVGHDIREVYAPVEWEQDGNAWVYIRTNPMDFPASKHDYPVEYAVRVEPVSDGLSAQMTVKNLGDTTLQNVVAHICLGHRSDRFRDPGYERTFILNGGKFLNLKESHRGGDPIRARYAVKGNEPIQFFQRAMQFWGPLSEEKADNGLILTRSQAGEEIVAFWFDPASELFQNSDERNMCIHSDPTFGDLEPEQAVTRQGRIIFFKGDLGAFQEQYLR